jgi:formylglycine-generating enzyme required for sulfatase activity
VLLAPVIVAGAAREEKKLPSSVTNSLGMKLVLIPPGKFVMGSPKEEAGRYYDEVEHVVEITRPFYLGVYEVTQAGYQKVTGKTPSWFSPTGAGKARVKGMNTSQFPVEQVSWEEARAFCDRLSAFSAEKDAGRVYRLPTEAEWEYACRIGTETPEPGPFHLGASLSSLQANFNGTVPYGKAARGPSLGRTAKVGSYKPSAVGVCDMHGNVMEWCHDWYDKDTYLKGPQKDPRGPAKGDFRVVRGGSWYGYATICRAAHRSYVGPTKQTNLIGFRVACTVPSMRP